MLQEEGDVVENKIAPVLKELPGWEDSLALGDFESLSAPSGHCGQRVQPCNLQMLLVVSFLLTGQRDWSASHFLSRPRGCATYWTLPVIACSAASWGGSASCASDWPSPDPVSQEFCLPHFSPPRTVICHLSEWVVGEQVIREENRGHGWGAFQGLRPLTPGVHPCSFVLWWAGPTLLFGALGEPSGMHGAQE